MKIRFKYSGPTGEIFIDHTEIAGMNDNQVEMYVAAKVRSEYAKKFEQTGITFYITYSTSSEDYHTKEPSKEINEV